MSLVIRRKISMKFISILFLMFLTFQLLANRTDQDTRPAELEYANEKLNDIYKKILRKMKPSDQLKLRKAQRTWIIFRDLDCTWALSAEPLDCLIDRTVNRVKELNETAFFDVKGDYLSIDNIKGSIWDPESYATNR